MRIRETERFRASRLPIAVLLAVIALVATAAAAEPGAERADYVRRLETICRPGVERTQRVVRGLRSDVRAERLAVAARKLSSAARIFDGTVSAISVVPRPPADTAQLHKWFAYLKLQESYLRRAAAALRDQRIVRYQHNAVRFVHNGNLANDTVIAFGFNYCRFKFSRFE